MLQITSNNIISMTRGDDVTIPLHIFTENSAFVNIAYFPNIHDKIFFAIMEPNQNFEDAIVRQIYTYDDVDQLTGVVNVKLKSYETQFLQPGDYYYTVKLLKKTPWEETDDSAGEVETVIGPTRFTITN